MKKYLSLLIALCLIISTASAIDYVGVNAGSKKGKFSKTNSPTFAEITATTANYTYTGTVTATTLTITGNGTVAGTLGVTGLATFTGNAAGNELDSRTATALLIGKATATSVALGASDAGVTIPGTLGVTGATTLGGIVIGATTVTADVVISTGNVNIPVTVNGVLLYIKANTAL